MPYRLQLHEPVEDAVQRICKSQIERAIISLKQANTPSHGVHEARKSIKKIRAVLKLIKSGIEKKIYQDLNIIMRDISRHLSATRDAQAMCAVLLKFKFHPELQVYKAAFDEIHDLIRQAQKNTETALYSTTAHQTRGKLEQVIPHIETLKFQSNPLGAIFAGFEKSYLKAATLMDFAYARQDSGPFHDWRKALQYHGRHIQLFFPAWPELFRLRQLATREIALILGEHNDLSVLTSFIHAHATELGEDKTVKKLLKIFAGHEHTLRLAARPRGVRLFAYTHDELHHHLKVYWKTAQDIMPLDDILRNQTEQAHSHHHNNSKQGTENICGTHKNTNNNTEQNITKNITENKGAHLKAYQE